MSKLNNKAHRWYKEYNWFLRNVGRVYRDEIDLVKNFPSLLEGVTEDRLKEIAQEIHRDMKRKYDGTRDRGRKPKMFPIIPRSQQFASPEVILLYLESLNND